jgi:hypothetical protein
MTPQTALAAPSAVGPTAARDGMIGQTPALDRNRLLAAMLDPNMPPDVAERAKAVFEATKPVETKAAPGDIGAYEAALARGFIPPGTTFQQFMTMRRPPGTTVNVGGEVSPFDKKVQEGKATMFLEIEKSGIAAQRSAQDINRLESCCLILTRVELRHLSSLLVTLELTQRILMIFKLHRQLLTNLFLHNVLLVLAPCLTQTLSCSNSLCHELLTSLEVTS